MKKSILVAVFSAIVLISLFLSTSQKYTGAQSLGTNVNGIINSDTTWTSDGSPYVLTGPVAINQGVTNILFVNLKNQR